MMRDERFVLLLAVTVLLGVVRTDRDVQLKGTGLTTNESTTLSNKDRANRVVQVFIVSTNMPPLYQSQAVNAVKEAYNTYGNHLDRATYISQLLYSKYFEYYWNVVANADAIYFFSDLNVYLRVVDGNNVSYYAIFSARK